MVAHAYTQGAPDTPAMQAELHTVPVLSSPAASISHVEPEQHDVAFLYNVLLPF